jgi:hypothetical protein
MQVIGDEGYLYPAALSFPCLAVVPCCFAAAALCFQIQLPRNAILVGNPTKSFAEAVSVKRHHGASSFQQAFE